MKPDAASFPAEGNIEEQKKEENLFSFNETEFKDEEGGINAAKKGTSEQQAGSLSNLLDLNNSQDDKLVDLSGADLPDDDDDDVLLKIDSELASSLQPGGSADLLGIGARRGQTEDFFKEEGREESEVL